jgi:DNA-binding transcriptional regulator YbjK
MAEVSNFERVLESVEALSVDEQEALIELVKRRLAERRRSEIAQNIAQAHREYQEGKVFRGTTDEIIALIEAMMTLVLASSYKLA